MSNNKNILGLDLGTNSIGWAVVNVDTHEDDREQITGICALGSRILPMDGKQLGAFQNGNSVSATADRTRLRGVRRLYQRQALRRERLLRVLRVMGFLPTHYAEALTRYGKFTEEVRLPWTKDASGEPVFLFRDSYEEMLADFRRAQPEWLGGGRKVPYDWTIYYLRKKALTQALLPEELAWVLLQFNQKRGYNLTRGMKDEFATDDGKREEILTLQIVSIEQGDKDKKGKGHWYDLHLSNGDVYRRIFREKPNWEGQERDFIKTTDVDEDGNPKTDKNGKVKQSISMPKPGEWRLMKMKTQHSIDASGKHVGEYIYDTLLTSPDTKIIGSHVRTIDRRFYERELLDILTTQQRLLPQLNDRTLYEACITELYPSNHAYRQSIATRDFVYLLGEDILLYQRPLKSKKSLIDECPYEKHTYTHNGEAKQVGVKCTQRSNPLFQELRLWQFIQKLRIYQREMVLNDGRVLIDQDVTDQMLPDEESRVRLYDTLSQLEEVDQKTFFAKCFEIKAPRKKNGVTPPLSYFWNYSQEENKTYPCCPTKASILKAMRKTGIEDAWLTNERLSHLWHILYSIDNHTQLRTTLERYIQRENLPSAFAETLAKLPAFKKEYGSYSTKAIKRLLPVMRMGSYWKQDDIDEDTRQRIHHILDGEVDDAISTQARDKLQSLSDINQFRGLPLHLACYVVYNRHSESADTERWEKPGDIDNFLSTFRQHSLHNPIVEQVVTETLRTVRDIWTQVGHINEIHLEMGRDLKQNAQQRKEQTQRINANEARNQRLRIMLAEFVDPSYGIDGVRAYSHSQHDILQIYEEGALARLDSSDQEYDFVNKMSTTACPTSAEIHRYRLWLDQKYISPYTGRTIPLARLFTPDYEIEHVIPRSRFFDDSMNNKVICEAAVNKLKDNKTGLEFIQKHGGETVALGGGDTVAVLSEKEYTALVQKNFASNRAKMKRLLMDDIPQEFVQRQLGDTRYISRYMMHLLSKIVRRPKGDDGTTSVNLIATNGAITDRLKHDWGMDQVWNHIILPRFQRMNQLTNSNAYTALSREGHEIPAMPLEKQQGFSKKRIDHRHHAMDAIVIACTTRRHVQLLNNEAANSGNATLRHQLSHLLRRYETETVGSTMRQVPKEFLMPWPTFPHDCEKALLDVVVSFKSNLRIINRTKNKYTRFLDGRKQTCIQQGDRWAIRKPLHKETVYGDVNLQLHREVKLSVALEHVDRILHPELRRELKRLLLAGIPAKKIPAHLPQDVWSDINFKAIPVLFYAHETKDRYYAVRTPLNTDFTEKVIREKISDIGIQKILLSHLANNGGNPAVAFSPEGIEQMNNDIEMLNQGRKHQPIRNVRLYEKANKFAVGNKGNKSTKFVEAAKGTNLFFAVYEHTELNKKTAEFITKRTFDSIPLNKAIEQQKQGLPVAPSEMDGDKLLFVLSPNDLVYVPTEQERREGITPTTLDRSRIYKMVSCQGNRCYFIPYAIATTIVNGLEFNALNKIEISITGENIKDVCLPIHINRIGNITEINGQTF